MKKERIYLSPPDLTGEEYRHISDILDSNWIAPVGPHLGDFETQIAEFTGFRYVLAVNSGTSAIHLALLCHGVQAGDLVISSTLTFCGAVNPILYLGAKPILVDSSFDDWNIDTTLLEQSIKGAAKKPKAILITHLFGMPANFEAIETIGRKYDIPVVHDMAEALGCRTSENKPGRVSEAAILSFNGNKLITTSGGGALLTNNLDHYKKGLLLSTQAKTHGTSYNHAELGYNYRMSNVLAGLGQGQFTAIDAKIAKKRNIFERYKEGLGEVEGVIFQQESEGLFSDRWLTAVYFDPEVFPSTLVPSVIAELDKNNIESRHIWKPMHMQPLYKDYPVFGGGVSQSLFEYGLCLPSGTGLTTDDQERVIDIILNTLRAYQ